MSLPHEKLMADCLDSYRAEYSELSAIWGSIDSKSQGSITACGVFIAGIFAFARTMPDDPNCVIRSLLTVAILLLCLCVLFSLLALRIRSVDYAPLGESLFELVDDLIEKDDLNDDDLVNFVGDQIQLWKDTNQQVATANGAKAWCLAKAQCLLVSAILITVVASLFLLWS